MSEEMKAPSYLEALNECKDYNRLCGYFAAIIAGLMQARDNPVFSKDYMPVVRDAEYFDYIRGALHAFQRRRDELHAMDEAVRIEEIRRTEEIGIAFRRFYACIKDVDNTFMGRPDSAEECMRDVHRICGELTLMRNQIWNGGCARVLGR